MAYTASGRRVGSSAGGLDIDIRGIPELQASLAKLTGPDLKRARQRITNAGGKELKGPIKAAVPANTHRLKRAISSRQAKRNRPATVVSARPKVAFYRHWVERGTKAHGPKKPGNKYLIFRGRDGQNVMVPRVRGVTHTTDYIGIGYARGQAAAISAMDKALAQYVDSI